MPKPQARFTQTEIARALRVAKAEGMTIEITADAIRVVPMPLRDAKAFVDPKQVPVP
jgi:hypothetical protein